MPIKVLDNENFDETIARNAIVFIDFWADWCQPCKTFAHIYEAMAAQHQDILFATVDVEKQSELAADFQVRSVPFLVVLKNQVAVYADSGSLPQKALEELIAQARQVDVSNLLTDEETD